ncbi:tetratricopeptide repeat protein [Rhizobium tubonense]|uniref:Cellulose synthase n=1 Tax=Rhizobium tubonense TaxID=484088 RepID=A0A2W4CPR9_9HYPH|nr:tetratricopeptide repeat protein [Rhizobium tubonense]PZM14682.1 cellulose synthase [Rhizobium tubonense]
MKPSFAALCAAVIVTIVFVGLSDRERFQRKIDALLNNTDPSPRPQLMHMGRISGPDFHSPDPRDDPSQQVAQADPQPADDGDGQAAVAPVATSDDAPATPTAIADATAPAVAQAAPPAAPAAAPAQPQPAVDESALRYFASRGDKARLQVEISRLRALYPSWTPPADPLAVPPNQDTKLEAMWQLYSESRYAELHRAITDRQSAEPGWQPPPDLLDRLDVAEARARLVNASDLKQYEKVVQTAAETPSLLTCSEVDVLWRLADAFAHSDRVPRSRDAYLYILKNCDNPAERLATIQKASAVLPYGTMQDLLSQEKPLPDGTREFESVRDDLSRRFVAEGNDDLKLTIAPEYASRLERLAETQGLASDALLLGWYDVRHQQMVEAEKWFRTARAKDDTASASQGLALTLIARKSPQEAEDIMYKWRDGSKDATATYLAATANLLALDPLPTLQPDVLQRIAVEVLKQHDTATAQQFGWYARALTQPATAAQWFETALRWKPDDEPSAYGLAITRQQLNDKQGVAEIQRLWAGRSERIALLGETKKPTIDGRAPLPAPGVDGAQTQVLANQQPVIRREPPGTQELALPREPRTVTTGQPSGTLAVRAPRARTGAGCSTTIDPEMLPPAQAVTRGWCLMGLNRPTEAAAAFEVGLRSATQKGREDAAYGQSLAYLRLGLTSNAAVAATKAPLSQQRALELQTSILTNRASNAFDTKRYREAILYLDQLSQLQPERIDLMVLRGYAYLNLKRFSDAIRIFEAAAATGNHDAISALSNARAAQRAAPR